MTAARLTQQVAEVLSDVSPNARVSHVVAEVLSEIDPIGRISQIVVEVLSEINPTARVSHIVVEVLSSTITEEEPAPSGSYRKRWGGVGNSPVASYAGIW